MRAGGSGDPPKVQDPEEQHHLHRCRGAAHPNLAPPSQGTSLAGTSTSVRPGGGQQQRGCGGTIHIVAPTFLFLIPNMTICYPNISLPHPKTLKYLMARPGWVWHLGTCSKGWMAPGAAQNQPWALVPSGMGKGEKKIGADGIHLEGSRFLSL